MLPWSRPRNRQTDAQEKIQIAFNGNNSNISNNNINNNIIINNNNNNNNIIINNNNNNNIINNKKRNKQFTKVPRKAELFLINCCQA